MGNESSKSVENLTQKDDADICDRILELEIVDDIFETVRLTDDTTQSAGDQETNSSEAPRVITFNVCSTKLAAKSQYFNKMFSNGMKETTSKVITMKIAAYEGPAFMDMMDYIKSNTLPRENISKLLELLMIAHKFDVSSCMKSCLDLLLLLDMDTELALLFSPLLGSIYKCGDFSILVDRVVMFFTEGLKNLDSFPDDIGDVNQDVIEMVLSRYDLCIDREDVAYDFLMKWVTSHFSNSEERREFLETHVCDLVHFPYMSKSKLASFYECAYLEDDFKNDIKLELESYEEEKKKRAQEGTWSLKKLIYTRRLYMYLQMTLEKPENSNGEYVVFLELDRRECDHLAKVGSKCTDTFEVGVNKFHLSMACKFNKDKKPSTLGIRMYAQQGRLVNIQFEVRCETKEKLNGPIQFLRMGREKTVLNRRKDSIGFDYLFKTEWATLMAPNSKFFINDTMFLRASIEIN